MNLHAAKRTTINGQPMMRLTVLWLLMALLLGSSWAVAAQEAAEANPGSSAMAEAVQAEAMIVDLPNAKRPWDHILIGGQPTQEQLTEVAAAGYGTVINLRSPGELTEWDEEAVVSSLGMRYVSIPVSGQKDLTEETAQQLAKQLEQAGDLPVLVHCASGNRVGAIFALKAFFLDGESAEEAMAIGERSGLRSLAPMVEGVLSGKSSP